MAFKSLAAAMAAVLSFVGVLSTGQANAAEVFAGVYQHDVTFLGNFVGLGAAGREHGADLHLGYRTGRLDGLRFLGRPQVHAFVSINSQLKSNFVATGLNWRIGLSDRLYLRPGIGLALTDGKTILPSAPQPGLPLAEQDRRASLYYNRIAFGSRLLFEPELALGYDITPRLAVEASYTHLSNGQIFHKGKNQGLDDAGIRLVWKLGA
jgi:hypothetical protein